MTEEAHITITGSDREANVALALLIDSLLARAGVYTHDQHFDAPAPMILNMSDEKRAKLIADIRRIHLHQTKGFDE